MTKRELLQQELKSVIMRLTDEQAREVLKILLAEKNKQDIPSIQATE